MASPRLTCEKDPAQIFKELGYSLEEIDEVFEDPILFSETLLYDPKKGKKIELSGIQKKILGSKYQSNVMNCHRRGGKTYSLVLLALWVLMTQMRGEVLLIVPDDKKIELFFNELWALIDFHPWIHESLAAKSKKPYRTRFKNGSRIVAITTGSSNKTDAAGVRGQGADYVLLDEIQSIGVSDWTAIKPIITGDSYRSQKTKTFATGTPLEAVGQFYEWWTKKGNGWNKIKYTIYDNERYTPEQVEVMRKDYSSFQWKTEYACEFLNAGASVFPLDHLQAAGKEFEYAITPMPGDYRDGRFVEVLGNQPVKRVWRAMGVDWDKYNADGNGPTIAVTEIDERPADPLTGFKGGTGKVRVIYAEHIPQSEYALIEACERIEALNERMNPDLIYIDRGYGEAQVELLKKYGVENPGSGLDKKVHGFMFKQNIEITNPLGGKEEKQLKPFMVNLLVKLIEEDKLEYAASDRVFLEQFQSYRIKSRNENSVVFTRDNEHLIDAVGLSCLALYKLHISPFRAPRAAETVLLPEQVIIRGDEITPEIMADVRRKSKSAAALILFNQPSVYRDSKSRRNVFNSKKSTTRSFTR